MAANPPLCVIKDVLKRIPDEAHKYMRRGDVVKAAGSCGRVYAEDKQARAVLGNFSQNARDKEVSDYVISLLACEYEELIRSADHNKLAEAFWCAVERVLGKVPGVFSFCCSWLMCATLHVVPVTDCRVADLIPPTMPMFISVRVAEPASNGQADRESRDAVRRHRRANHVPRLGKQPLSEITLPSFCSFPISTFWLLP